MLVLKIIKAYVNIISIVDIIIKLRIDKKALVLVAVSVTLLVKAVYVERKGGVSGDLMRESGV